MRARSILFVLSVVGIASAFVGTSLSSSTTRKTRLYFGPLQKLTDRAEYNKVVEGLMFTQGITREQAEKEYDCKAKAIL